MDGQRRLVLASSSPRRREIVSALAPSLVCMAPDMVEPPPESGELPEEYVRRLSLEKARSVAASSGSAVILGADTAVVLDGEVLGKPGDREEARRMLRRLRGRTHRVVTGVTVLDGRAGGWLASAKTSEVTMRPYSEVEIAAYVDSGAPLDKAGAYAVQDGEFRPVAALDGCYLNVVGLPLCEVVTLLERLGAPGRLRDDWSPPAECVDCTLGHRSGVASP